MIFDNKKILIGANFLSGYAFKSNNLGTSGVPVIKIGNIQNRIATTYNSQQFPFKLLDKKISKYFLQQGDILIAMTGQGSVGRVGKLKLENGEEALLNQRVGKFICDEVLLNRDFLYYVISSQPFENYLFSLGLGSGQPNLSPETILNVEIPFPEYPVQTRIASILSSLDDKIELNRRMNQTLEQMAQALFNHYFVDNIDPDNLPEGWRYGKLGEVCNNIKNNISHNQINNETVYIGLEHLPRKSLAIYEAGNSENLGSNKFKFKENHILFGKLRPYFHKVIFAPFDGVCSTDILVIEPKKQEYYSYCLLQFYSEQIIDYATQFSHGTRMPRVNWDSLSRYKVAIPPIGVASDFNSIILPLLEKVKAGIRETKILTDLRDTLLPKLMSGEIDVDALLKKEEQRIENLETA